MFSLCFFSPPSSEKRNSCCTNIQDHQLYFDMSHTYRLLYTGNRNRGWKHLWIEFYVAVFPVQPLKSLLVVYNLNIMQQADYVYANLKTLLLHVQAAWISQITVLTLLSGSSPQITCHSCLHLWHLPGWLLISFTIWFYLKRKSAAKQLRSKQLSLKSRRLCVRFTHTFRILLRLVWKHCSPHTHQGRICLISTRPWVLNYGFSHHIPWDVIHKRSDINNISYFCASPFRWLNVF